MVRMQVYLNPAQQKELKLKAKKTHGSVTGLIRQAIWDNDPIINAIGSMEADVTDASVNHDKYLYIL